jgi:hypothetical protein
MRIGEQTGIERRSITRTAVIAMAVVASILAPAIKTDSGYIFKIARKCGNTSRSDQLRFEVVEVAHP